MLGCTKCADSAVLNFSLARPDYLLIFTTQVVIHVAGVLLQTISPNKLTITDISNESTSLLKSPNSLLYPPLTGYFPEILVIS